MREAQALTESMRNRVGFLGRNVVRLVRGAAYNPRQIPRTPLLSSQLLRISLTSLTTLRPIGTG